MGSGQALAFARRNLTAICGVAVVALAELVLAILTPTRQAEVVGWTSTNVHNLSTDPLGCLIASFLVIQGDLVFWPILIGVGLLAVNGRLGHWRTVSLAVAAHVIGTLVSEGILAWRVDAGSLPTSSRFISDVGASYVVVAVLVAGIIVGSRNWRIASLIGFGALTPSIFGGLTSLQVPAVGHVTAIGVAVATCMRWRRVSGLPATAEVMP